MILLPLGHDESEVRRLPWVSFTIMAICLLSLLLTDFSKVEAIPTQDMYLTDASDYWREHLYLEPSPQVVIDVSYDVMPNQRRMYIDLLKQQGYDTLAYLDREVVAKEQKVFDRLMGLADGSIVNESSDATNNPFMRWGLTPTKPRAMNFITYIFMHGGWMHLIGNMFMLLIAGAAIEDRFGRPLFGAFFVLGGMVAGVIHLAMNAGVNVPMVGASGSVAAIFGAFLVRFTHTKIRFFYLIGGIPPLFWKGTVEIPALVIASLWFLRELANAGFATGLGVTTGVAYWAHVGGFAFGAVGALAIRHFKVEERFIAAAIDDKVTLVAANPVLEEAMEARNNGELEKAFEMLQREAKRHPKDPDLALAFWDTAVSCQRAEDAVASMGTLIEHTLRSKETEQALAYWRELQHMIPDALVAPALLMKLLPGLIETHSLDTAQTQLRHCVDPGNRGLTLGMAMRVVEAARELDPPSALGAARQALRSPDMHESKRDKLLELVQALEAEGIAEHPPIVLASAGVSQGARPSPVEAIDVPLSEPLPVESAPLSQLPPPLPVEPPPIPLVSAAETVEGPAVEPQFEDPELFGMGFVDLARFSAVKEREIVPVALLDEGLRMNMSDGRGASLRFDKIEAVAVGLVKDLGPKPVLVMDLALNWSTTEEQTLKVARIRSDRFDPRKLLGRDLPPLKAFKLFFHQLLERSGATALPGAEALDGKNLPTFETLASYHGEVLQVSA